MNQTKERIQNVVLFLTDLVSLLLGYYGSGIAWMIGYKNLSVAYANVLMSANITVVMVAFLLVSLFYNGNKNFTVRGIYEEGKSVVYKCALMGGIIAISELLSRTSANKEGFPRGLYVFTLIFGAVLMLLTRVAVKGYLVHIRSAKNDVLHMLIITTQANVKTVVAQMNDKENWMRRVIGIAIVDADMTGQKIEDIPIVANAHTMMQYIKNEIVDEVYINVPYDRVSSLQDTILKLENMGVAVHLKLAVMDYFSDFASTFGKINGTPVVTFANRFYDYRAMAIKRLMDILGGFVGLIIMIIAMIFVAPAIKIESKGPLFFKQKRVGKNGRYFYIYKFRSMYIDAEERKKELMAQNEMSGLMFKMTDDPRITKVGKFIRKTSIDELPQFINVLMGDMSLVGTRPPTVGEFKQYGAHHKRRLSMKPGITGMWQAYGRNTVEDFEDVVKMDLDYIDNWSLGLDIKILFKTVAMVLTEGGK